MTLTEEYRAMGLIVNRGTGEHVLLRANHVFGRNAAQSDTVLPDPEVSLLHAIVRWRDGRWSITDLSRNGTFLDGRLLGRGQAVALSCGQLMRFGSLRVDGWYVENLAPPSSALLPVQPARPPIRLSRHNLLPDDVTPQCSVYETEPGHWMLEEQGEGRPLVEGDIVCLAGVEYRLRIDVDLADTRVSDSGAELPMFSIRMSQDEEHTRLVLVGGAFHADLGERSHHYLLATLARKRLADAAMKIDTNAQGWLDCTDLTRMLGVELTHLNIQIFRARDQLMNAMPDAAGLAQVIERRRGGVRLGAVAFEILRGSRCEGRFDPVRGAHD